MAVAIASNLGIHVGGRPLFADVSFKLEPRDRMTLSGRNGAGKSTLLRILAGELPPDSRRAQLGKGRAGRPARPAPAAGAGDDRSATTCSRAAREMLETEAELERLEAAMSGRRATTRRR